MLKTKDILDEKDKRLRLVSKEVEFPLTKKDKDLINTMIEYLHNSQIEELAEKYDLRAGMGMSAIQLGVAKRYFVVVNEITEEDDEEQKFETYILVNPKIISNSMEKIYVDGKTPQLNLLTDRMMLKEMNNCGAGDTNITLAPNGKFYVCPAFYYEDEADSIGDLEHGLDIKNKQLYRLDHAPICRHCDAWQCKRCIWLNRKTTLEVNTPSHEQCVLAHLERNASRDLLNNIRKYGTFLPEQEEIKEIDYLDPFDKRDEWQ